jgi:hypothetical protein
MDVPENVVNKELYRKVKKEADGVFADKTSAYRSMWISKTYKKRGGKYSGKKEGLTKRWRDEEWVVVSDYVEDKKKVPCGTDKKQKKACRPLEKVSKDTPITMDEILDKWGKEKVLELARKKMNDMEGRLNWVAGTFTPSKRK